ncbi:uncharacterized protein LOC143470894 [Clavelina lepadiformis]|uniref:uncharacterized protein LOC143470894 n=1 Tax=Clavelina lepadiformis TaxID=159417 RepID=UPI004042B9DF
MSYLQPIQGKFSTLHHSQGHAQVASSPHAPSCSNVPCDLAFDVSEPPQVESVDIPLIDFGVDSLLDLPRSLHRRPTPGRSVQFSATNPFLPDVHSTPLSHSPETKAVKLPSFWPGRATQWFEFVEIQFRRANISSNNDKFDHVVLALDPAHAERVASVLCSPSSSHDDLKAALLNKFGPSLNERLSALLDSRTFQGKKPSDTLEHMKSLLGSYSLDNEMAYNLLRKLFLDSLDYQAQMMLKIDPKRDLDKLALKADEIMAITKPVSANPVPRQSVINELFETKLDELTKQLTKLDQHMRPTASTTPHSAPPLSRVPQASPTEYHQRDRFHGLRQSGPTSFGRRFNREYSGHEQDSDFHGLCFYHSKFGHRAFQCKPPCNWNSRQNAPKNA